MWTQKKEAFCLAFLETGNAAESYRRAYDVKNMKPETIIKRSGELFSEREVKARLQELRAPAIKAAQLKLEQHLGDLARLRDAAESEGKYGPAIQAEIARGKAAGLYVEKIDMNVTGALAERLARAKKRSDS